MAHRGFAKRAIPLVMFLLAAVAGDAEGAVFDVPCSGSGGGAAGLAEAIATANGEPGADSVTLAPGCTYSYTAADNTWFGPNALPPIASAITIEGRGARIERSAAGGTPPFRLFFVGANPLADGYTSPGAGTLTLADVTVAGGLARGGAGYHGGGGGGGMGGAIFNMGAVTLNRATLVDNAARGGGGGTDGTGGGGGGIGADATSNAGAGFGGAFPSDIGAAGGAGGAGGGGGGGGLRSSETGGAATASAPGRGGGPTTGTGGHAVPITTPPGDGAGAGAGTSQVAVGSAGGGFGFGGNAISGAGGVGGGGGGGGDSWSGGGGGFGGGGGGGSFTSDSESVGYHGAGGFGGGGGGSRHSTGTVVGAGAGFGGGWGNGDPTVGMTFGGGGAGLGGAIFNLQGAVSISTSTLAANTASGGAGGAAAGSTASGQPGDGFGGAIFNLNGSLTIFDGTLAANNATRGDGTVGMGRAIYTMGYDAAAARASSTELHRTIVAYGAGSTSDVVTWNKDYTGVTCTPSPCPPVLTTASTDAVDHNLVMSHEQLGSGTFGGTPITAHPLLAQLGTYRRALTPTMPPTKNSPVLDEGGSGCPFLDQAGQQRPNGAACDIGAVEMVAPDNDDFADARAITGTDTTITGDNLGATHEQLEPNHAAAGGDASVWFRWTAPTAGTTTIDTCLSTGDPPLAVYSGSNYGALIEVASDSSGCAGEKLSFSAVAGTTYRIAVDAPPALEGVVTVTVLGQASADQTPPDTVIDAGPTSPTNDDLPSFAFHATEPGSGFECSLDQGAAEYEPCDSGAFQTEFALADGSWTFRVRATDPSGNLDPTAALRSFTVDTVAPAVTIDSGPSGSTTETSATFSFSSTDAGATFTCTLDAAAPATCTSPRGYSALVDGAHTFTVVAVDAAGNESTTPATRTWTVDTAPETMIDSGPTGSTADPNPVFTFSSPDGGATFKCKVDAAEFATCTSPRGYSLAEGTHTFSVVAVDAAGNEDITPATRTWTVDYTSPETIIDSGPTGPTAATSATFTFSSPEPGTTFRCKLDNGALETCTSPRGYSSLADGVHYVTVLAVDAAGNEDQTPASQTWTVDTTAPETTFGSGPTGSTAATSATLTFSSPDPGTTFRCKLDDGAFDTCTSPHEYGSLADGPHTFSVAAVDAVGNQDTTPASRTWTVDTAPPQTMIDSYPPSTTTATSATLTFSSPDADATFRCSLDNGEFTTCTSPKEYGSLAEGRHTFDVFAVDAAGNNAYPVEVEWLVVTPPTTTIDSYLPSWTSATSAMFTFSSPVTGATFRCKLDNAEFETCTSPHEYSSLAEAEHEFTVFAVDGYGYEGNSVSSQWTVDTTHPETVIDSGPTGSTTNTSAAFTFSSPDPGASFDCKLDDGVFDTCTSPREYSGLAQGVHTFEVAAVDPARNVDQTPASRTWTIEASPGEGGIDPAGSPTPSEPSGPVTGLSPTATELFGPVTDLTAPNTRIVRGPRRTRARRPVFVFRSTESVSTFLCRIDRKPYRRCKSGARLRRLRAGRHTLRVKAVDAAGNADTTPAVRRFVVVQR